VAVVGLSALGCGGGSVGPRASSVPAAAWPAVGESGRLAYFERLGAELYMRLQQGDRAAVLVPDGEIGDYLLEGAMRRVLIRRSVQTSPVWREVGRDFRATEFAGVCFQGIRVEGADGPLGLRTSLAIVDRALVVGRRRDGARVATWLEGAIVAQPEGLRGLYLQEISPVRWEHSDLQLAACDMRVGDY